MLKNSNKKLKPELLINLVIRIVEVESYKSGGDENNKKNCSN